MPAKSPNPPDSRGLAPNLAGPWLAMLSDAHRFVYPTPVDAVEALGTESVVNIAVVRGTAAPRPEADGLARRPIVWAAGDIAAEAVVPLNSLDPTDPCGALARFEQAQAMAAGLNADARRPAPATEPGA